MKKGNSCYILEIFSNQTVVTMKINKKFKKILKIATIAGVLVFGRSQINHSLNDLYNYIHPSEIRTDFKKQFGFPIKGWYEDIEGNGKNISKIIQVIETEKQERNFSLNSIRIKTNNKDNQSLWDKLEEKIVNPVGYYINNQIVLGENAEENVLHHEIKHAKTFDIMEQNPELLTEWKKLSLDQNGNSLYLSNLEQVYTYISGLESLIDERKKVSSENVKLGFIDNYARTNIFEDIAELSELVECKPKELMNLFYGDNKNETIIKKIKLAQRYGLIPKDYTNYLELQYLISKNKLKTKEYFVLTDKFLKENPESIYESQIKLDRADLLLNEIKKKNSKTKIENAIDEYEYILNSRYKDLVVYPVALQRLESLYQIKGNLEMSNLYRKAYKEYLIRLNNGDTSLPTNGVNDILMSNENVIF
ncbi:MAG: hypothetical protein PHF86_08295 [Candidatus Nanoarchaeia archaeon]|nr:hypothetical protein [Candidatus Nanoarchaeia archaeon]